MADPLARGAPFLFGCATAAHQVEGGNSNDWTRWEAAGRTREPSGAACDSWNRFDADLACLQALGANAYRLSIEWSRLEPAEGAWDAAAARYREMLAKLRAAGIASMVTLHHFTLPTWVADRGGAEWAGGADAFAAFAVRSARAIGEPDLWCTVNEPNVVAFMGYVAGIFPPGAHNPARALRVMRNLDRWHHAAVAALRSAGFHAPIGLAHHMRPMDPLNPANPAHRVAAKLFERAFHAIPERGFADSDWIGLNYYSRDRIGLGTVQPTPGAPQNDLGWEIHPEGLYRCLLALKRFGKPILVTENGICDAKGDKRPAFLADHLAAMARARDEGVDVRGYFHWSLLDNFEWAEGYAPRFGLYAVDPATFERTPASGAGEFRAAARELIRPTTPR
jgi:beta-glucosidase